MQNTLIGLDNKINLIDTKIELYNNAHKQTYESIKYKNDRTLGNISDQISLTSNLISILSVFFTVLGILLGVWMQKKYNQIKQIDTLTQNRKKEIQDFLENNSNDLYRKIRDEDTTQMLKRLVEIPEDIENLAGILLARSMDYKHFPLLKSAFINSGYVENKVIGGGDLYMTLILQHFPVEAFLDAEIGEISKKSILPVYTTNMFQNDWINFTKAIISFSKQKNNTDLILKLITCLFTQDKIVNHRPKIKIIDLTSLLKKEDFNLQKIIESSVSMLQTEKNEYKNWFLNLDK